MTYAELVKGKSHNNQGQEMGEGTQGTTTQKNGNQPKQADYSKVIEDMMAKQKASEATIADMQQAMAKMAESQTQLMAAIQDMVKGLPGMIRKAMGNANNAPEETQEEQGWMKSSQESEVLHNGRGVQQHQPERPQYKIVGCLQSLDENKEWL